MAKSKIVHYECSLCGNEVSVEGKETSNVGPIYCCGVVTAKKKAVRSVKAGGSSSRSRGSVKKAAKTRRRAP